MQTQPLIKEYSSAMEEKKVNVSNVSREGVLTWDAVDGYSSCEYDGLLYGLF